MYHHKNVLCQARNNPMLFIRTCAYLPAAKLLASPHIRTSLVPGMCSSSSTHVVVYPSALGRQWATDHDHCRTKSNTRHSKQAPRESWYDVHRYSITELFSSPAGMTGYRHSLQHHEQTFAGIHCRLVCVCTVRVPNCLYTPPCAHLSRPSVISLSRYSSVRFSRQSGASSPTTDGAGRQSHSSSNSNEIQKSCCMLGLRAIEGSRQRYCCCGVGMLD